MNWIDSTVGEFCPFIYGKGLPQSKRKAGNVPVYGLNGRVDYHDESHVKQHGIVIERKGSVGVIHLCEEPFWPIDTAFYVEKESIDELRFTYYLLKSLGLEHMNLDSAVPGLNRKNAQSLTIKIPEQVQDREALGAWIAKFDQKIALNRQINQTLESMAQAIFKSWFVDFDPVKAKIAALESGEDAEGATCAAMRAISGKTDDELGKLQARQPEDYAQLKTTAELFPAAMQDSELGEVPEGWRVRQIDQIADFLNGLALQKFPPRDDEYLPVIKIRELKQGITESSGKASVDIDGKYVVDDGDVLFSWSGSLIVCVWCDGRGALNQHLFNVTSLNYPKWFYYQWIQYYLPEFQHIAAGKATTMGHIKRHHLSEALVTVPPEAFMSKIDPIMDGLLNQYIQNSIETRNLITIRDTLLPKLMYGEIKVRIENIVEDAHEN